MMPLRDGPSVVSEESSDPPGPVCVGESGPDLPTPASFIMLQLQAFPYDFTPETPWI